MSDELRQSGPSVDTGKRSKREIHHTSHKKLRQKKGAAREATARNYDVAADVRKLIEERMDKSRWFTLYIIIIALFGSVTIADVLKLR